MRGIYHVVSNFIIQYFDTKADKKITFLDNVRLIFHFLNELDEEDIKTSCRSNVAMLSHCTYTDCI